MYAIMIPVWKRHDLTREVIRYYNQFKDKYDYHIYVCGSEGNQSKELAQGNEYLEFRNFPVGEKNNALIKFAAKNNYTGVAIVGSDDFLSEEILQFYKDLQHENHVYSFDEVCFFRTSDNKLSRLKTTKMGVGRFYPLQLIKDSKAKLWDSINSGLDASAEKNALKLGYPIKYISLSELNGLIVDVKHSISISAHAIVDVGEPINISIMAKKPAIKEAIEKVVTLPKKEIPTFKAGETRKFKSNGTNKYMNKKDVVYEIDALTAYKFEQRGFGEIIN